MAKFEIGDRVKYVPLIPAPQMKVYIGKVSDLIGCASNQEYRIIWDEFPDSSQVGHYDTTLEAEFVKPTDEELAELARKARKEYYESVNALIDRGFTVQVEGNMNPTKKFVNTDKALVIKRVVTTEVVL